jgi:CheY-like chemotaxis protein
LKLNFGLLWIEDEFSPQQKEEISSGAAQAGFELEITVSKDGSDIDELARKQEKFHLFDLILLDLNLLKGVQGDELAPKVRRLFRSTPILFYSGSATVTELRDRMAKKGIEGVFCSERRDFTRRASELIIDYAPTLNRLSGMRGLAMEIVAEIDVICRRIITKIAVGELETFAADCLTKEVVALSQKNLDEFPPLPGLAAKMQHRATDSMKSFNAFREVLRKHIGSLPAGQAKDELSRLRNATKDYRIKVLEVRNTLGHALETKDENGWLINDSNGKPYMSVANFTSYRTDFQDHLKAMKEIESLLVPEK